MAAAESDDSRETYLAERKLLMELECESTRSFDKAMITLSAGALGLSITFIRQIAPMPQVKSLLYVAWGGFILCLLSTLLSFLFSQSAMRKQRGILDQDYIGELDISAQTNLWAKTTKFLNVSSIACFMVGVVFFVWFSITNLPKEEDTVSKEIVKTAQPEAEDVKKKGLVPPNLPVKPQPSPKPPAPDPPKTAGSGKK
jgi:hypothetical protein